MSYYDEYGLKNAATKRAKQFVGRSFGSLVVVKSIPGTKGKAPVFECRCACGNVQRFRKSIVVTGRANACGKCRFNAAIEMKRAINVDRSCLSRRFHMYAENAKLKNLAFHLTKEQCYGFFLSTCHYCGAPPGSNASRRSDRASVKVNGIDRVDNSMGYITSNCVACCAKCNYAKRDTSVSDFLLWVSAVFKKSVRA